MTSRRAFLIGLCAVAAPGTATASGRDEKRRRRGHDEALAFRRGGGIMALPGVLKRVRQQIKLNDIIEVDFEAEDGAPMYEIKAVTNTGRVVEIYADARTGKVKRIKGR